MYEKMGRVIDEQGVKVMDDLFIMLYLLYGMSL